MTSPRLAAACAAAAFTFAVAACSSSTHAARTVLATPSYNPRVAPTVAAYLAYIDATDTARKDPPPTGAPAPGSAADFAAHAVDPVRTQTVTYLAGLRVSGMAWRGSPPKHMVFVLSTRLDAKPYPAVTLGDCALPSPSWQEYTVADGVAVPKSSAPQYRVSAEVVMHAGQWFVATVTTDRQHLCG